MTAEKYLYCDLSIEKKMISDSGVPRGGVWGVQNPHPQILKELQNRVKLNPIVKTIKNC